MTLRISFEYQCSLLWLVDYSDGLFLENVVINSKGYFESNYSDLNKKPYFKRFPEERLRDRKDLEDACEHLNSVYSTLFIDNEVEFSYKGFDSKKEKRNYLRLLNKFCNEIKKLLADRYTLEIEEGIVKGRNW